MAKKPIRVVLNIEGGVIHEIRATESVEVIVLDYDIEGVDPSQHTMIEHNEVYVTVAQADVSHNDLQSTLAQVDAYLSGQPLEE